MKEYKVEIIYKEDKGRKEMHTVVNGKDKPLPREIARWIAKDFINELFYKENEK